ncbi:Pyridoxamine 5'-phosphate oxidase [Neolecta irregularis DAH-3]|uniref:Pyridoxamine 5'-phosphate oxidase n=1 Tax=Neolecta irregularis (strain DAH-3) TaxID=1198029 RepID=A0A1U7LVI1_NEOID|nr:Pyridoxamine 5'-phosphate oxidase [Neolecta irregularis DAH-3]|eukprot:OLL26685.1 Pyridoxamine 5'-phosphate oxidase [Neolecta irregularis DAH-3]
MAPTSLSPHWESPQLPPEVVSCLKHSRYLHLGTCHNDYPHISLMNFTYVPKGSQYEEHDCIILTCRRNTKKFINITANPRVSLLVHDWVSPRSQTNTTPSASALSFFLQNLNQAELSSISATLNGTAWPLEAAEAAYYKELHLQANPPEARRYVDCPDMVVVKVRITSARIVDTEDHVEKWGSEGPAMGTAGSESSI